MVLARSREVLFNVATDSPLVALEHSTNGTLGCSRRYRRFHHVLSFRNLATKVREVVGQTPRWWLRRKGCLVESDVSLDSNDPVRPRVLVMSHA